MQSQPVITQAPAPYYVQGRPTPYATESEARIAAGLLQRNGLQRSLRILRGDQVVSLKRF